MIKSPSTKAVHLTKNETAQLITTFQAPKEGKK